MEELMTSSDEHWSVC